MKILTKNKALSNIIKACQKKLRLENNLFYLDYKLFNQSNLLYNI